MAAQPFLARLGLKIAAAAAMTLSGATTGTVAHFRNADATITRVTADAFGTGVAPIFTGRLARGTFAAPTAVQTDDTMASFNAYGYGATGYSSTFRAHLAFKCAENWTDAAQGTYVAIGVTTAGGTTAVEALRLTSALGTFSGGISVTGQIASTLATGTAPFTVASATLVANLYAARAALADSVTTNANLTGPITSVGNATSIASQTGTGTKFVVDTSPTLVTPIIGAATSTSLVVGSALLATFTTASTPSLQVINTGANGSAIGMARFNSTAANASSLIQARSKGATLGDYTAVIAADTLANNLYQGSDGATFANAANLQVAVDAGATVSSGVVPGRFRLLTANSAGTLTQGLALDSQQVVLIGAATTQGSTLYSSAAATPLLQVIGTTLAGSSASVASFRNANTGPTLFLGKSRSGTIGTMTLVAASDVLGNIDFQGADGTNFVAGVRIIASATGTPAAGVIPGSLVIQTANTSGTLTTALTVDNAQGVTFTGTVTCVNVSSTGSFATSSTNGFSSTGSTTAFITGSGNVRFYRSGGTITANAGDAVCQTGDSAARGFYWANGTTPAICMRLTAAGNFVLGAAAAALSTSATDGFLYLPTCAGTPSGVPTSFTGNCAFVYDTTNNKLYVYNGAWKSTAALT